MEFGIFNSLYVPKSEYEHEADQWAVEAQRLQNEINWTKLHYAGDGKFSYEEDIYNPIEFGDMIKGWLNVKKRLASGG